MPCAFQLDDLRRRSPGCEFAVPDHELIPWEDKDWCQFHLPITRKARWEEARVDAFNVQLLDYIDRAKQAHEVADLSGVVFPGSITFERYAGEHNDLPKLMFLECTFGEASFAGVRFSRGVDFQRATFSGDAGFQGVTFGGETSFKSVIFSRNASFEGATFSHNACFDEAIFDEHASFSRSSFHGYVHLQHVKFNNEADFRTLRSARTSCLLGQSSNATLGSTRPSSGTTLG